MLKSELLDKLNEKLPELRETDVALALDCILGQMIDALAQGERIEIRGFGSFSVRHRAPRGHATPRLRKPLNCQQKRPHTLSRARKCETG